MLEKDWDAPEVMFMYLRAYSAWERLGCACGYLYIRELLAVRANQNLASIG